MGNELKMQTLRPRTGPKGFDAYCHICWEPIFSLWCDDEPPDYTKCGIGDYSAQTCPNAIAGAHNAATIAKLREQGLIGPPLIQENDNAA